MMRPRFACGMDGTEVWLGVDVSDTYADALLYVQVSFTVRRPRAIAFWDWLLPEWHGAKGWCSRRA